MWHDDEAYQRWAKEQQRKPNDMARWSLPEQQRVMAQGMRDY
jgi:hypothetical protein